MQHVLKIQYILGVFLCSFAYVNLECVKVNNKCCSCFFVLCCGLIYPFTKAFIHLFMCMLCNEEREIDLAIPQCSVMLIELDNTKIVIHQITCHLNAFP